MCTNVVLRESARRDRANFSIDSKERINIWQLGLIIGILIRYQGERRSHQSIPTIKLGIVEGREGRPEITTHAIG